MKAEIKVAESSQWGEIETIIKSINDEKGIGKLLERLGYNIQIGSLYIPDFDLPESAKKLIEKLILMANYDKKFQIYFAKVSSMRRTDFRTILEPFYRRYPQINSLFIFTRDFNEIAFVSPLRVAVDDNKTKLCLRILFLEPQNIYHTDLEVLSLISIKGLPPQADIIWEKHKEAFNIEKVTKEFFEAFKFALNYIKERLLEQKKDSPQQAHSFALLLLSRIMFLYFVQKKGLLWWKSYDISKGRKFLKNLWNTYKESGRQKDTFYRGWLSPLFFYAFNKDKYKIQQTNLPEEVKEAFTLAPFLNGGLFTRNKLDKLGFNVPDDVFTLLFEIDHVDKKRGFFERYNFTVREDTPYEVEVAVDPEMLGKVYESLILEEERGKAGIFYTPRIEIDYMCRLSLVEYLHEQLKIDKTKLIPLIFEPKKIVEDPQLPDENLREIKKALDDVKIVDPAVGSASFLVGMMNILVEIHNNLYLKLRLASSEGVNLLALKEKIICENLYGVDVKDWAIMVGELRLWLSLIIETDPQHMDLYNKPLLPNLTFKMRQGDSLVEEIANTFLSLRGKFAYIPQTIKSKIVELMHRKEKYFSGIRSADLKEKEEIERLENEIFKEILEGEIKRLNQQEEIIKQKLSSPKPQQLQMFGLSPQQTNQLQEEITKLELQLKDIKKERQNLSNVLKELGKKTEKDYFLWEVDFAEVFYEKGGFDIVIGNPPYVRHENIGPPLATKEDRSPEKWKKLKQLYEEKLIQSVNLHWGNQVKIDGRSDLYVYFYYQGLSLLRPGGIFCFINSNSWLDVKFGAPLQEFLLKNMQPVQIIDNLARRTFVESDINTVIVLIKRPEGQLQDIPLKFVAFKKPFEEVLKTDILVQIENATKRDLLNDDYRIFPKSREELLEEGIEISEEGEKGLIKNYMHLPYIGNKWGGKYIRAPEIFFYILNEKKNLLISLAKIASFAGYIHDNNISPRFPKARVILSSQLLSTISVYKNHENVVLIGVRSTRSSRLVPDLVVGRTFHDRFLVNYNVDGLLFKRFYKIMLKEKRYVIPVCLLLNSTLHVMFWEAIGIPEGLGALNVYPDDFRLIMLPKKALENLFEENFKGFLHREIKSIFEELGLPKPNKDYSNIEPAEVSLGKVLPDRRELDKVVFEALGLTEEEQLEVYRAVVELVKNRLVKAKSVKQNKWKRK